MFRTVLLSASIIFLSTNSSFAIFLSPVPFSAHPISTPNYYQRFRFDVGVTPLASPQLASEQLASDREARIITDANSVSDANSQKKPQLSNVSRFSAKIPIRKVSKVNLYQKTRGRYTRRLDCALFCKTTGFHGTIGGCSCGFSLFKRSRGQRSASVN